MCAPRDRAPRSQDARAGHVPPPAKAAPEELYVFLLEGQPGRNADALHLDPAANTWPYLFFLTRVCVCTHSRESELPASG